MTPSRIRLVAFLGLAIATVAAAPSSPPAGGAATGKVSIRLVQLLSEVPNDVAKQSGPLQDLRVELVPGNVLVFRKGSEFAALLPIDRVEGGRVDSLRYFFYVEKSPMLWFFGGGRSKGIRTVADGGSFQFDTFRLAWGKGGETGWIYFPDIPENQGLRFSVVSGQSVDDADPKDTKYWVELGSEGKAGF